MPRKRLPIQGVPTERATCRGCDKKLAPCARNVYTKVDHESGGYHLEVTERHFTGWNSYLGFHTLSCALYFANAAYKAGYRKPK